MKIKTFLFTFNRPDILELQISCLKQYLKDDFDIFVVNDSRDEKYLNEFLNICFENNIEMLIHQSYSGKTPSQYHADTVEWVFNECLDDRCENDDIVLFLDHDMFLIEEIKLETYFDNYDVIGLLQTRENIKYVWPGIMAFVYSKLKNFDFNFQPQVVNGQHLDTGGGTYKILQDESIRFYNTKVSYPSTYKDCDLTKHENNNGYGYELHLDDTILHFRNASSWHNNFIVNNSDNKNILLKQILGDFL